MMIPCLQKPIIVNSFCEKIEKERRSTLVSGRSLEESVDAIVQEEMASEGIAYVPSINFIKQ